MLKHPEYFSSLRPFKQLFRLGFPILTYHKLGPRPSHVRIKGLYLSEKLFRHQLHSLSQNGFLSLSLDDAAHDPLPVGIGAAITFDDAYESVFRYGLPILLEQEVIGLQFIVADHIGKTNFWDVAQGEVEERLMDEGQIREWLAEGQMIGSHTLTHPHLSKLPAPKAQEEIYASKAKLEDMFGVAVNHFCYPYGDWSPAVIDWVGQAGYKTACTVVPGINLPDTPKLSLHRFTARYASRNIKAWWKRFQNWNQELRVES